MKPPAHDPSEEPDPPETTALLQRILAAVELDERKRWVEIASAVLLGLAGVTSTWCGYESTRWGGRQSFQLSAAARPGREANLHRTLATQYRAFDVNMLLPYIEARNRGDEKTAEFWRERFRPEARKALDAWLQIDPFNNPNAPKRPFELAEYEQPELAAAERADEEGAKLVAAARPAREIADNYVQITVLCSSVLFFAGIGHTMRARRLRMSVLAIAAVLFAIALVALAALPICRVH